MFHPKKSNGQGNGYFAYTQHRRWLNISVIVVMSMLLLVINFVTLNTNTTVAAAAPAHVQPQKIDNKLSFAPPTENQIQFNEEFVSDLPVREINSLGSRDNTMSIAIGDLNADGLLDIVFGNGPKDSDPEVNRIFYNDPQDPGNFSNPDLLHDIGEPTKTSSVVLADLNGDGMLDIVFGNMGTPNEIFFNDGQGQFDERQPFGTETGDTNGIAVGDVDGDGFLDIAVGNWGTFEAPEENRLYLNDGTGTFSLENSRIIGSTPRPSASIAFGDIDQQNGLDIVVGNSFAENEVFFNDGAANFDNDDLLKIFGVDRDGNGRYDDDYHQNVVLGDVNTDGVLDIVSLNQIDDHLFVTYLQYDDEGVIDPAVTEFIPFPLFLETAYDEHGFEYSYGSQVTDVVLADINSDGWLDFVAGVGSSEAPDRSRVYFNPLIEQCAVDQLSIVDTLIDDPDALGFDDLTLEEQELLFAGIEDCGDAQNKVSFADAMVFGAETTTSAVAAADLDNDGMLDIVEASWQGQISWVYYLETVGLFSTLDTFNGGTNIQAMTTGDVNNDGQIDIIATRFNTTTHRTFLNDLASYGAFAFFEEGVTFGEGGGGNNIALADMNNDSHLDIIISYINAPNQIFYNDAAGLGQFGTEAGFIDFDTLARDPLDPLNPDDPDEFDEPLRPEKTQAFAIGDLDHKNGLDVVVANEGQNSVYLNDGSGGLTFAYGFGDPFLHTAGVALGDFNQDGYLDVVVGNITAFGEAYLSPQPNLVYLNDTTGQLLPGIPFGEATPTSNIAVGDFNGDSALDVAVGNDNAEQNGIYFGDGSGALFLDSVFGGRLGTLHLEAADLDADGDLDLIERIFGKIIAHINNGNGRFRSLEPIDSGYGVKALALGDLNADGLPELIYGFSDYGACGESIGDYGCIQWNTTRLTNQPFSSSGGLPNNPPFIKPYRPWQTETITPQLQTRGFSAPQIFNNRFITIPYKLYDNEGDHVGRVEGYYSLDGGGSWLPAIPANVTDTLNLETTPWGALYEFVWDTRQSGVFGQSDNVVLSLLAYPTSRTAAPVGTFTYTGTTAVSQQRPYASASTFPFRVAGTQIQVSQSGDEGILEQAIVMHLPNSQVIGARPLSNARGQEFHPDNLGFLRGRGSVAISDTLFAMVPVTPTLPFSFTDKVTLFHTNGIPTEETLQGHEVTASGIQLLETSADNPLLLFNLDVSLEWNAHNDDLFLQALAEKFRLASATLFDATNGQAALGHINIYHDKEYWDEADVIIFANNSMRPSAVIGGITNKSISETVKLGDGTKVVPDAYGPGRVRMGTIWDPFGQSSAEFGEDWWQALAHELSHYLFFLPDNYLGIRDNGVIGRIECQNSFMTSTYDPAFTEFLTDAAWQGDCLESIAANTTARSDWQTISAFYPMLDGDELLNGPTTLPLEVVSFRSVGPQETRTPIASRMFDVRKIGGERQRLPNAQVYLIQTQQTADLTDDTIMLLGTPTGGGDRINVRGGYAGDRLCLFGTSGEKRYAGCNDDLQATDVKIEVEEIEISAENPAWNPTIRAEPLSQHDFRIIVEQPLANANAELKAQVYPAHYASAPCLTNLSPVITLNNNGDTHDGIATLRLPAYDVTVRVWQEGEPTHETVTQFLLNFPANEYALLPYTGGGQTAVSQSDCHVPTGLIGYRNGKLIGDPISRPIADPISRPIADPISRPIADPISRPIADPISRPIADPISRPIADPISRPIADPISRPIADPISRPIADVPKNSAGAPQRSTDAQVTIYNQNGFFEENGIVRMEILPVIPEIESHTWLVPVGQAYRIILDADMRDPRTIAFNYLQRDVPAGYEHTLTLYFLEEGTTNWKAVDTTQYVENLVVAELQEAQGIYALMAAVAMPDQLVFGWNLISYPVPVNRSVEDALASILDVTAAIYPAATVDSTSGIVTQPPQVSEQARLNPQNQLEKPQDLTYLQFGKQYWVYVTEPTQLFYAVPVRTPTGELR